MIGNWFGQSFGQWFGQTTPVAVETVTGGWWYPRWDRRKKRDDEELADALEAHLLHVGTINPETPKQKVLQFMAHRAPDEIPKHVKDSIIRAVRSETVAAYSLALKRMREIEEEEDFAVIIALH